MEKISDRIIDKVTLVSAEYIHNLLRVADEEKLDRNEIVTAGAEIALVVANVSNFRDYEIPSAGVVPVVRCRDCKYLVFSDCYGECAFAGIVLPDDFCSRGERKDGEGDG